MSTRANKTYRQRVKDDFLISLGSLFIGLAIGIYATLAIIVLWL